MSQQHSKQSDWKSTTAFVLSCLAVIITVIALFSNSKLKIGYVRSKDLISKYSGMKEAEQLFESRQNQWKSEIDTLQSDYRQTVGEYSSEYAHLAADERAKREELLHRQEENLRNYTNVLYERSKESEQRITQGLYDQINTIAQAFGKTRGFDMILGTAQSGSIIYGSDALDVTEELLQELNATYKPGEIKEDTARHE